MYVWKEPISKESCHPSFVIASKQQQATFKNASRTLFELGFLGKFQRSYEKVAWKYLTKAEASFLSQNPELSHAFVARIWMKLRGVHKAIPRIEKCFFPFQSASLLGAKLNFPRRLAWICFLTNIVGRGGRLVKPTTLLVRIFSSARSYPAIRSFSQ